MGFVVAAFPVVVTFVVAQCELVALSEIAAGHVQFTLALCAVVFCFYDFMGDV